MSPHELVAQAYRQYGHLVLQRCRVLLRNNDQASDAMQDVFVRLMRYGSNFQSSESPVRWLYRVADRVCFDMMRGNKKSPYSLGEWVDTIADSTDLAARHTEADTVLRFLARFDDKTRQVAVLYFLDGLSQEEVAQELGWSRQTIHKKIQNIRAEAEVLKHKNQELNHARE